MYAALIQTMVDTDTCSDTVLSELFVVFAARRRNCVGQSFAMHEMKVTIARILRR